MSPARPRVLLVDDEASIRFAIRDFLDTQGIDVVEACSCEEGRRAFTETAPDVVILDYSLPDGTALDMLARFRAEDPSVPVIVLTAHGSIDLAVKSVKEGAEQFLTKPVELPALLLVLTRAMENQRYRKVSTAGSSRDSRDAVDVFLGTSAAIRRLEREAHMALDSMSPVLLLGETGAGKGVLARWLHRNGRRAAEPFVDLNCAGLSRELLESELFGHEKGAFTGAVATKGGLLEAAHRGTLFLDEIGDMDPAIQPRFLKVLEEQRYRRVGDVRERRVDVRLISATHHDLEARVAEGRFRDDLFYRIAAIPLRVPPLRERREDIVPLAQVLLERLSADLGRPGIKLGSSAAEALTRHDWPGNTRELRNVLERALLTTRGHVIEGSLLPLAQAVPSPEPAANGHGDLGLTLEDLERRHVEQVLAAEGGHVDRAAVRLGISRSTLYQKIKRYQLDPRRA